MENTVQNTSEQDFSTEIFNVTQEADDFTIILSNLTDEVDLELGGRRC